MPMRMTTTSPVEARRHDRSSSAAVASIAIVRIATITTAAVSIVIGSDPVPSTVQRPFGLATTKIAMSQRSSGADLPARFRDEPPCRKETRI